MPYRNIENRRRAQRERLTRLREEWLADKVCASCGTSENLEVDHVDPEQKVSHRVWVWNAARRAAELAKCQALCHDCHQTKTKASQFGPLEHGTVRRWRQHGCRCAPCREAGASWRKNGRRITPQP